MRITQAASSGFLAISLTATALGAPLQRSSFAVFGRVTTSDGSPVRGGVSIMLTAIDGDLSFGQAVDADGTFRVEDVMPGRYVIAARPQFNPLEDAVPGEGGFALVTVGNGDAGPIHVRTRPTCSMQGHVRLDSDDPNPTKPVSVALHAVSVFTRGAGESFLSTTRVRADGSFTLHNLIGPAIVRFGMELQPGHYWFPGPVLLDGKDVTNVPTDFAEHQGGNLEVVFTQRSSGLYGRARDATGAPVPGAYVIAVSQDPSLQEVWSSTTTAAQADDDGRYQIFVPPGRYLVAAVDPSTFSSWDHARRNFAAIEAVAGSANVQESTWGYQDVTLVKPTKPIRPLPESRAVEEVR